MTEVKNRSELIFIYDVTDNNPNGDPLNENKARIDEETGINIVTDVRLKRTIRDFIALKYNQKAPNKIFMAVERKENGSLMNMEERTKEYESIPTLMNDCIDIRLFGGTIAIKSDDKKGNNAITGPVQFRLGRSMHKIAENEMQITRVVPNKTDMAQGTFGAFQKLHYSLIKFYGMINENTAVHSKLSEEDVQKLLRATWHGTNELCTHSKIGHKARVLIKIDYKPNNFVGAIDSKVKIDIKEGLSEEQIRSTDDYIINIEKLVEVLTQNKDKIERIYYEIDSDINLSKPFLVEGVEMKKLSEQSWFNAFQTV